MMIPADTYQQFPSNTDKQPSAHLEPYDEDQTSESQQLTKLSRSTGASQQSHLSASQRVNKHPFAAPAYPQGRQRQASQPSHILPSAMVNDDIYPSSQDGKSRSRSRAQEQSTTHKVPDQRSSQNSARQPLRVAGAQQQPPKTFKLENHPGRPGNDQPLDRIPIINYDRQPDGRRGSPGMATQSRSTRTNIPKDSSFIAHGKPDKQQIAEDVALADYIKGQSKLNPKVTLPLAPPKKQGPLFKPSIEFLAPDILVRSIDQKGLFEGRLRLTMQNTEKTTWDEVHHDVAQFRRGVAGVTQHFDVVESDLKNLGQAKHNALKQATIKTKRYSESGEFLAAGCDDLEKATHRMFNKRQRNHF